MRLLTAVLTALLSFNVAAQTLDAKAIDRLMTSTMKAWQIPGAAVVIVRNDRVVYANGYGVKSATGTDPVTADTLFQIGSNSKAFTSTALAMLVDDGKLSWDDHVRDHVDYFRLDDDCADAQVTVRDILSHRTGLARHDELWDNTSWSREDVVRRIGFVPLDAGFRSAYQYQNIMYIAAGEVVTHTAGMTWDDFVRTRIFQPLAMTHTTTSDAEWKAADHASGHRYDWKKDRIAPQTAEDTTTIGAAGAVKSTARDMGNWLRFQLANGAFNGTQLVDPVILNETKMPQTPIRLEGLAYDMNPVTNVASYGMGWIAQDYRGELLVSHAGALNGFRSHVDLLPKRNAGFVVMLNAGRGLAAVALRNSLADMLSGNSSRDWNSYYLVVERGADVKEQQKKDAIRAQRKSGTKPSLPLGEYAGEYENRGYGTLTITESQGALWMQWNSLMIPLEHFHYDVFSAVSENDDIDEQVVFDLGPDGTVSALKVFGQTFSRKSPRQSSR